MIEPIDSRQLHVFMVLARKGGLKAAAAELCLTASAISHSIANLESNLRVQLFHRSGRGLVLTEKGKYLLENSGPIVAQMADLRQRLTDEHLVDGGPLKVAVGHSFLQCFMPGLVAEFNECFSKPQITVWAIERDQRLQALRKQEIDVAIMTDPPEEAPEFICTPLFEDELKLVLPASHALARFATVPMRSLGGSTLLVRQRQARTVQACLAQIRREGFEVKECVESGGVGGILEMVKLGQGFALQPDWILDRVARPAGLAIRPIENLNLTRTWAHVRLQWKRPNLADRTLLRLCQRMAANLRPRNDHATPGGALVAPSALTGAAGR